MRLAMSTAWRHLVALLGAYSCTCLLACEPASYPAGGGGVLGTDHESKSEASSSAPSAGPGAGGSDPTPASPGRRCEVAAAVAKAKACTVATRAECTAEGTRYVVGDGVPRDFAARTRCSPTHAFSTTAWRARRWAPRSQREKGRTRTDRRQCSLSTTDARWVRSSHA